MRAVNRLGSAAATALVAAFATTGLAACQDETSGPESGVSVREIQRGTGKESDQRYVGREVTVSADVNRVLGPHAFVIAGTESGVEPLLVVHPARLGKGQLNESSPVKVTGTVRSGFDRANVERALEFEFDRDVFNDYRGAPYIAATSIETSL